MDAASTDSTTRTLLFAVTALIFGAMAALAAWRIWRHEGNRAEQLANSKWILFPGCMAVLSLVALVSRQPPQMLILVILFGGILGWIGLVLAAAVTDTRGLREEEARRRDLGLEPRRQKVPTRVIAIAWVVGVMASWLFIAVAIGALFDWLWYQPGQNPPSFAVPLFGALVMGIPLVLAVVGIAHTTVHRRRIRSEDAVIRAGDRAQLGIELRRPSPKPVQDPWWIHSEALEVASVVAPIVVGVGTFVFWWLRSGGGPAAAAVIAAVAGMVTTAVLLVARRMASAGRPGAVQMVAAGFFGWAVIVLAAYTAL